MRNVLRKADGFTLLEIIVVVAIMAILAGILLPRMVGQTEKAREKKAKADLILIASSLSMVRLDNPQVEKYCPLADLDNPKTDSPTGDAEGTPAAFSNWNGPYMIFNEVSGGTSPDVPDDPWGNDYILDVSTVNGYGYATIKSKGKDGSEGTADDIVHKFF